LAHQVRRTWGAGAVAHTNRRFDFRRVNPIQGVRAAATRSVTTRILAGKRPVTHRITNNPATDYCAML
jgi:hypothetical protein